ncbi:MAG TPA: TonB-dependent receptor plug domain-containing protein, partial [Chitinophagaceae bacterium]|nr:TonB-dependent receptor plug domain-containing protein [Chitinophagaceae bacterium]
MKKMKKNPPGAAPVWSRMLLVALLLSLQMPLLVFAQQRMIKGHIVNESGQPVEGVSIIIKGTTKGTSTDLNGNFSIDAGSSTVLVISSVGYAGQELAIGKKDNIAVRLINSNKDLGEVVVVGYGTQKKKDVTGSVVSINEAALREVPVANLQGALQGRAAGLEVQTVGSTPGSGAQIRIRGIRSISGSNDPLLVLDGIPYEGSLNDINPDDVASVDVLKDASATAIYGSRGANGVIIVSTKRGRSGETHVSFNSYYGIGTPSFKYPVFNGTEYRAMRDISPWAQGYLAEEQSNIAKGKETNW